MPRLYRGSEGSRASRRARAGASSNCCLHAAQKLRAHRTRLKRGSRGGRSGQLRCYARHLGWQPPPRAVEAAQNTVWSTQQKPQQTRLPQQYGCCDSATVVCDGSPGCCARFRDDDKIRASGILALPWFPSYWLSKRLRRRTRTAERARAFIPVRCAFKRPRAARLAGLTTSKTSWARKGHFPARASNCAPPPRRAHTLERTCYASTPTTVAPLRRSSRAHETRAAPPRRTYE